MIYMYSVKFGTVNRFVHGDAVVNSPLGPDRLQISDFQCRLATRFLPPAQPPSK